MRKCLYSKCDVDFEPKKPKQKFCCAIHRVYYSREAAPKKEDKRKNNGNPNNFKKKTESPPDQFKYDIEKMANEEYLKILNKNKQS